MDHPSGNAELPGGVNKKPPHLFYEVQQPLKMHQQLQYWSRAAINAEDTFSYITLAEVRPDTPG